MRLVELVWHHASSQAPTQPPEEEMDSSALEVRARRLEQEQQDLSDEMGHAAYSLSAGSPLLPLGVHRDIGGLFHAAKAVASFHSRLRAGALPPETPQQEE